MGTPRDIDEIVADEEGLITVDGLDRLPCAACPLMKIAEEADAGKAGQEGK
jgi:hypothetical protein